ncbi:caspase-8-like [Ceratina calcarata]|uniref:Caspase-8-like n=1 Tax=Ceratina calcarata TaxID=156304 RepID=A0AAJ7N9R5_9HYME|nr:caspase-8-like [Ceratina calcarata]
MFLNIDAVPNSMLPSSVNKQKLSKEILLKLEDDLDIDEKISILFLMLNTDGYQEVFDLLQKYKKHKGRMLGEFIDKHPEDWENKLLESLCIIKNKQIIRKLGLSYEELDALYLPRTNCSRHLNPVSKCLYLLCEQLSEDRIKLLLQFVKNDMPVYDENLTDTDFLELHMLYWIHQNYISIYSVGKVRLQNLLQYLKRYEDLELIYEDLKTHVNHQNVLDIQHISPTNVDHLRGFSMREEDTQGVLNVKERNLKRINKGLCVIISQMLFASQKYETRFGTIADCKKLSDTFKGFGFTIAIYHNLNKDEILKKIKDIPTDFGTDYDCIFLCILSHGCKGGIISADVEEISIETIDHKFCCTELKDVIKVVIIQACQGDLNGQVNDTQSDDITTDGGADKDVPNILAFQNFCIFMSTMQGFVSVRHKEEGSWFIQEFCNILQTGKNLTFTEIAGQTINSVMNKRGKLNGTNSIAQLPELRQWRLHSDFQFPNWSCEE